MVVETTLPGQTLPFGFFDPLGLARPIDEKSLKLWREAELKHGRICMLASLGILVAEKFNPLFGGRILGPAIYHFQQVQSVWPSFWLVILFSVSIIEVYTIRKGWETRGEQTGDAAQLKEDYIPGDLNFDPMNLMPFKPTKFDRMTDEFVEKRDKELNNGRLAMIGTAGMIAQELMDQRPIAEHLWEFGLRPAGPNLGAMVSTAIETATSLSTATA